MFLAPVDIRAYILFTIIVTSKIGTNDSRLWSCVCYYQFLALYDKRSLQSNHICKFGKISLCVQSAVILIHRSHLRRKTFKFQHTEMACLMVLKTKLL